MVNEQEKEHILDKIEWDISEWLQLAREQYKDWEEMKVSETIPTAEGIKRTEELLRELRKWRTELREALQKRKQLLTELASL